MATKGSLIPRDAGTFGMYELISKLAEGGMAEIFLARDPHARPPRLLVIKRVLPHMAEDARFISMFCDEARIAKRIEHPNVCSVLEWGKVDNRYFMALEYLHGMPLSQILKKSANTQDLLDVRVVTAMIVQACRGLHHAHELTNSEGKPLNVVHRDVSPHNMFLDEDGCLKMLDFGVAKATGATQRTRTGTVKGKNAYMSPEQILGEPLDRRSDLFSLGIVMWEALTSSRLFARETDFLTFQAITEVDVPDVTRRRLAVPGSLAEVLNKCLTRDPEDRFATAAEMADAIEAAMDHYCMIASNKELARYLDKNFDSELAAKRRLCAIARSSRPAPSAKTPTLPLGWQDILTPDPVSEVVNRTPPPVITETDTVAPLPPIPPLPPLPPPQDLQPQSHVPGISVSVADQGGSARTYEIIRWTLTLVAMLVAFIAGFYC